ncbi:Lipid phosphate phosphatase [Musa troglodytarum]|uniref:Lipid phosphate phosphatase n=1 Tax=Musa troglodytarum TaxID=320322 RepID=A0A9E7IGZ9_9LILI|nr:Lipid phosphate phosphatase [Musa troglodytarum]
MEDTELGAHTVASHGVKVARFHLHDWIMLLLLGALELAFYVVDPFDRFVGKDTMADLKYPLKSTTVPFWAVPIIAVLLPCLVFVAIYFRRRDVYDLHHAILGILYSVLVSGMLTDAVKDAVGRPRPDFFWRCFPVGKEVSDTVTTRAIGHGRKGMIKDGHKSFPSGHASWSFAGLGFFSWYLAGKIQAFDRRGHIAKLCLVFLPLLVACMVSISLVNDYLHHRGDVFAGGLLGWGTHAYLQVSTETRNGGRTWRARGNTGEAEAGFGTHNSSCEDEGGDASLAGRRDMLPEERV